jgi:flavin prenyltransferase
VEQKLVVGVSGATGVVYGVRLLEVLRETEDVETHLVMTRHAELTLSLETDYTLDYVRSLADVTYNPGDLGATIASGSFLTSGMIVAPCSIKSLSGIANSYEETLLIRAAGVHLKEGRRLALMVRESPLHLGHLRLLVAAAEQGALIVPPLPSFYTRPSTIDELIGQTVGRLLDLFDLDAGSIDRWRGTRDTARAKRDR